MSGRFDECVQGRRVSTVAFVLAALLCLARAAHAQEFRGTIVGRVLDPTGATIPGATVVVTNEATNVSADTTTRADGAYVVPFLNPGTYRVEVEVIGFKKFVRAGVTVATTQRVTVDVVLETGDVAETIVVTANASMIDRTSGALGQVIDRDRVESTPLNGRMVFMLNRLAGGVNWQVPNLGATGTSGLRPFDNNGGSAWSINGGRVTTNEFLLDGAPDSTRGRYNFSPPVDAVEQVKIQTNTYDAQYGRTGGGVVNVALKSGTNAYRGQAWEFLKNDALNAVDTLSRGRGVGNAPYSAHQYGGVVGGPVIRDRTFFMGTFEGLRERVPFPTTATVPTEAERNGDFSVSYADQVTPLVIYDPLTTRPDPNNPGRYLRDPFPGNKIPADRINPIAKQLLAIYPLPNVLNQRLNNHVNPINQAQYDYNAELVRIDHNFSDASKMFLSAHRNHRDEHRSQNGLQGTFANQGEWPQTRENHGLTVDWVRTIGTRALLNVRGGFTHFTEQSRQSDVEAFDAASLGFGRLPGKFLPRIDLNQYTNIGVGSGGIASDDRTTSLQGNYTLPLARQTIKFGGEYRYIQTRPHTSGNSNGFFNFTRDFTRRDPNSADNTSGNAVASLLLGYPQNGNIGGGNARDERWHYTALFLQDDLRVSQRLTLNLGVRWDYESGVYDAQNRLVRGFAFDQRSPLADAVRNAPGASQCPACADLQGGLLFAGVGDVPRQLFEPDTNNIQPRVGFAYGVNAKTVVRGGYGLYYRFRDQLGPQTGFFVDTPYLAYDINGRVGIPELGVNRFSNPFPNGPLTPPGASDGLLTQVGRGVSFDTPTNTVPNIQQYNATLSREITTNFTVEVSYVGSRSRNLSVGHNINGVSAADLAKGSAYLQQTVTNPFAGLLPGTSLNGDTVQRQQLLRPYPQFNAANGVVQNAQSIGRAWYNALQLIVEKRLSHGLSVTSSYTFSKTTERNNFLNDQDTELVRRQPADYDRRHIWVLSGAYELPFGRDRLVGRHMSGLLDGVVGGWQLNWNFAWQSGRPLDMPGGLEPIPGQSAVLSHPTAKQWFNTCYEDLNGVAQRCQPDQTPVWRQRPPFTLRTTPNRFDDVRVPWKPLLDASLFKRIRFTGSKSLELRIEAFNLTNTVIWEVPSTDFAGGNFGQIPDPKRSVYFARQVQLGIKFRF